MVLTVETIFFDVENKVDDEDDDEDDVDAGIGELFSLSASSSLLSN